MTRNTYTRAFTHRRKWRSGAGSCLCFGSLSSCASSPHSFGSSTLFPARLSSSAAGKADSGIEPDDETRPYSKQHTGEQFHPGLLPPHLGLGKSRVIARLLCGGYGRAERVQMRSIVLLGFSTSLAGSAEPLGIFFLDRY